MFFYSLCEMQMLCYFQFGEALLASCPILHVVKIQEKKCFHIITIIYMMDFIGSLSRSILHLKLWCGSGDTSWDMPQCLLLGACCPVASLGGHRNLCFKSRSEVVLSLHVQSFLFSGWLVGLSVCNSLPVELHVLLARHTACIFYQHLKTVLFCQGLGW